MSVIFAWNGSTENKENTIIHVYARLGEEILLDTDLPFYNIAPLPDTPIPDVVRCETTANGSVLKDDYYNIVDNTIYEKVILPLAIFNVKGTVNNHIKSVYYGKELVIDVTGYFPSDGAWFAKIESNNRYFSMVYTGKTRTIYQDISVTDKIDRDTFINLMVKGRYADGKSILEKTSLYEKVVDAKTINEIINRIVKLQYNQDPTFKSNRIEVVTVLPQTSTINKVYFLED